MFCEIFRKLYLSGCQHVVWVDVLEMMKERMKEFETLLLLQESCKIILGWWGLNIKDCITCGDGVQLYFRSICVNCLKKWIYIYFCELTSLCNYILKYFIETGGLNTK